MKNPIIAAFSEKQKQLRGLITEHDHFSEAIELVLEQHSITHLHDVTQSNTTSHADELWNGLTEDCFRVIYKPTIGSIAFNLWHMTRIEDITMNILVNDGIQVFDAFIDKLNSPISHTGTAISPEGIIELTTMIDMNTLKEYSIAVGKKTRETILNFTFDDLKRKFRENQLQRILDEKAVLDIEEAQWILDFWGRKDVAGILLMPCTRHNFSHLNQCYRIKERWTKKNK